MNKVLKVLGYILIGIVLLPIIAIGLYVALGGSLFLGLYIYNRKKMVPTTPGKGSRIRLRLRFYFL